MKKTNNCNHPEIFRLAGPGDYIIANEYGIPLEIVSSSQARILAHSEKAEFTEGLQNAYYRIIKNYQEALNTQNIITHLKFEKQKILDPHERVLKVS